MSTFELPQSLEEFKDAMKRGIEFFSAESTHDYSTKFENATAHALYMRDKDYLDTAETNMLNDEKELELEKNKYLISGNASMGFSVGGVPVPQIIEDSSAYFFDTVDERIDHIISMLREESGFKKEKRAQLKRLLNTEDEYVLVSTSSNEIVLKSEDVEAFNEEIEEILSYID